MNEPKRSALEAAVEAALQRERAKESAEQARHRRELEALAELKSDLKGDGEFFTRHAIAASDGFDYIRISNPEFELDIRMREQTGYDLNFQRKFPGLNGPTAGIRLAGNPPKSEVGCTRDEAIQISGAWIAEVIKSAR